METRRPGRPRTVPRMEQRMGMKLEHYVMDQMAAGRTSRQIAAALGLSVYTIKRHLRRRGYRIECNTTLVLIERPPRPERRNGAARQLARPG